MIKTAHVELKAILSMAFILTAPNLLAAEWNDMSSGIQLAGEIIVSPQGGASAAPDASDLIDRARSQRQDDVPGATTIILIPEPGIFEQGVLTPGPSGFPNSAKSNRLKAKKYQQDGSAGADTGIILIEPAEDDATAQGRARSNRARANSYANGDLKSVLTGKVGTDGIPIVVCKGVNNQAGRIGDDVESGNVFSIFQNGRPVKVRCQ